jgi:hypothetical protein
VPTALHCEKLHAIIPVRTCLLRQSCCGRQRTQQTTRGQGTYFPSCDGCAQGAAVRAEHGALDWRGAGPGGRFDRSRFGQIAARRRLERVGLLDAVPSIDEELDGAE